MTDFQFFFPFKYREVVQNETSQVAGSILHCLLIILLVRRLLESFSRERNVVNVEVSFTSWSFGFRPIICDMKNDSLLK